MSRDGKNNEVYAAGTVCSVDRQTPANVTCTLVQSAVHGDVNGFPGRVKAGTGSASGGITSGNSVGASPWGTTGGFATSTFPFVLWEGTLLPAKETVWIAPSLWESGGAQQALLYWYGNTKFPLSLGGYHVNGVDAATTTAALGGGFVVHNHPGRGICGHLHQGHDRPVGVAPAPSGNDLPGLTCSWIGLTREKAEAVLGGGPQEAMKPVGVLTIDLPDAVSGHYVMYLKLERRP